MRCGEPLGKDVRREEIIEKIDADTRRKIAVTLEEWTYNYGPNKLIRIYQFTSGILSDIRTGGYGM